MENTCSWREVPPVSWDAEPAQPENLITRDLTIKELPTGSESCHFLKGNGEGVDLGERGSRGQGRVEGGETVIGI